MNHVVMLSGGIGSWGAAKRAVERYGKGAVYTLFTDTAMEDEDLYRFMAEANDNIGLEEGHRLAYKDGRTPWDVFFDEHMIGNSRADVCSRILKREPARRMVEALFPASDTTIHLGHGWDEQHRIVKARRNWAPYALDAPMSWEPFLSKDEVFEWARREGLTPPRLYEMGFPHNNCGGFCVRAGHAHFRHLLLTMPERYAHHEQREREFRERFGKDVSVLRDRRGGVTKPLTLEEFRRRVMDGLTEDELDDWGGCGCFTDFPEEERP